jgi:hypothetical protein
MAYTDRLTDKKSQDFANQIGQAFTSLPHLPKNWVQFFVKIAPVLALIGAILSFIAGPILGLMSIVSLLTLNPVIVLTVVGAAVLSFLSSVILFSAYKPLQQRKYAGWMLLFWSQALGAAQTLFHIALRQQGILSLIWIAVGFYILYEMRSWYGVKGKLEDVRAKLT